MPIKSNLRRVLCSAVLSFLTFSSFSQVIGSSEAGGKTPQDVSPSALTAGGLNGDVNVFNGTYNASYPLGSVSTPGGLSFALSMNYANQFTGGDTPPIITGVPYGDGWNCNVPMITISTDAYSKYSYVQNCALLGLTQVSVTRDWGIGESLQEGDIYWFAPHLSIPSAGGGRMVLKSLDDSTGTARFVCHNFEDPIEAVFDGSRWSVYLSDGTVYEFDLIQTAYRNPTGTRTQDYNQVTDWEATPGFQSFQANEVRNSAMPKEEATMWHCTRIYNLNLPLQAIFFDYEKFGGFNYFKEINQASLEVALANELRGNPLLSFPDLTAYRDVFLSSIRSVDRSGRLEEIRLDYGSESLSGTQHLLDFRDQDVFRFDSLYSYKSVFDQGHNGVDFDGPWRRYLHWKSDEAYNVLGTGSAAMSATNPYLANGANQGNYLRTAPINQVGQIAFDHAFIESPRIGGTSGSFGERLIPGDLYEVRATTYNSYGSSSSYDGIGSVDINLVTGFAGFGQNNGTSIGPDHETYTGIRFKASRGETVFSTFQRPLKWLNKVNIDGTVTTSNFFTMPNQPTEYQGFHIQVGPANSDHQFNLNPDSDTSVVEFFQGNLIPTAYGAYQHYRASSGNPGGIGQTIQAGDVIPSNFGIGLSWSMVNRVVKSVRGNHLTGNDYPYSPQYRFWWETYFQIFQNGGPRWTNQPTVFDGNTGLTRLELRRYSKNPYMLQSVKTYRYEGETGQSADQGAVLISHVIMDYEVRFDRIIENRRYNIGDPIFYSDLERNIYLLKSIKTLPTNATENNPPVITQNLLDSAYRITLEYEPLNDQLITVKDTSTVAMGYTYALSKIVNTLGGETRIGYYPITDLKHSFYDLKYRPQRPCSDNSTTLPIQGDPIVYSVKPTVRTIERFSEEPGGLVKRWDYAYSKRTYKPDQMSLVSNFHGNDIGSSEKGFLSTTVTQPELASGVRPYTTYHHHGPDWDALFVVDSVVPVEVVLGTDTLTQNVTYFHYDPISRSDYLLFGKLKQVNQYNAGDTLLERRDLSYGFSKAYENGMARPGLVHRPTITHRDYDDYVRGVTGSIPAPSVYHQGVNSVYEGAYFYESLFYDQLDDDLRLNGGAPLTEALETYMSSWFIKLKKEVNTEFEPLSCQKIPVTGQVVEPYEIPTDIPNSKGDGYTNVAINDNKAFLLNLIDTYTDTASLVTTLRQNSPLEDDVLLHLINRGGIPGDCLRRVMNKQADLSNAVLTALLEDNSAIDNTSLRRILTNQSYLTDDLLIRAIDREPFLVDTDLRRSLRQSYPLYHEVLTALLDRSAPIDANVLAGIFSKQGNLNPIFLDGLIDRHPTLAENVIKRAFSVQEVVPDDQLLRLLTHKPALSSGVIRSIYLSLPDYPSEQVLITLLQDPDVSRNAKKNVLLGAPHPLPYPVLTLASTVLRPAQYDEVINAQNGQSPLLGYCSSPTDTVTLGISTNTEYEYYEAAPNGKTVSEGYKRLLGLEQMDSIQLVYEPSWKRYKSTTFSPQYPGAYTQTEEFYYYDLGNRYQRYIENYDADKFVTVPDLNHPLGGLAYRILPGGVSPNSYEAPPIDGGVKSLEHGLRDLIFEQRTTTQNNLGATPIVLSEYFHYDARWNVTIDENITIVDTVLGPPCPPPGSGNVSSDSLVIGQGCQRFEYVSDNYQSAIPFGFTVYRHNSGETWLCPTSTLANQYGNLEVLYANPPSQEQRFQPLPYLLSNQLRLRSTHSQVDTLPRSPYDAQTYFNEELPLMDWENNGVDTLLRVKWEPIFPYDVLQTNFVHERQEHGLVTLAEDEKGLITRFGYGTSHRTWYRDPGCHLNSFMSTTLNHIGKLDRMTVGVYLNDSLTTSYSYYPDHSVDSINKPNNHSLHYEYDLYGRLYRSFENDRLLTQHRYGYFLGDTALSFRNRSEQNFVETATLLDDDVLIANIGRAFVDPLGRALSSTSGAVNDFATDLPVGQVISGAIQYDNWDRTDRSYKPFLFTHPNPSDPKLELRSNLIDGLPDDQFYYSSTYEQDHRNRPLREAKPDEDIQSGHFVKYDYKFINYLQLACELQISLVEQELLFGPAQNAGTGNNPNLFLYRRVQTTDEDGKTIIEYSNAMGQKVATKALINASEEAITLFFYDQYHQLTKIINPEKQHSDFLHNALGWMYQKETVDGGVCKYMFNRSGLITLEQNGQGRDGDFLPAAGDTAQYFWRYQYDEFNRITKQERIPAYNSESGGGFVGANRTQTLSPLLYQTTNGSAPDPQTDPLNYYEYVMSNGSTLDWLARVTIAEEGQFQNIAARLSPLEMLYDGAALTEKQWGYNDDFTGFNLTTLPPNGLILIQQHRTSMMGNLSFTITYDDGNFTIGSNPVHYSIYSYDAEERPMWEFQQFRAEGITQLDPGISMRIDYADYNNYGSIETENIDIGNDGTLDFQNHFVYDGFNRLRQVYGNYADQKETGNLLVEYGWNNALDLQVTSQYYASCPETDGVVGFNQLVDVHRFFYDIRDRMTEFDSHFLEYQLYYDQDLPASLNGTSVIADNNFNGNINAIETHYVLGANAPAIVQNSPPNFNFSTQYGYRYDGINRLYMADAIVGDHVAGQAPGSPYFTMGDATYDFDKIGNFSRLERFLPFDGNGTANSQFEAWQYGYASGNNHLQVALPSGIASLRNFQYDGAGNLLSDSYRSISSTNYGRMNLPFDLSIADSSQRMLYDENDARIHKRLVDQNGGNPMLVSSEFYLRDAAGNEIAIHDELTDSWSWFAFGVKRFARMTPDSVQQPSANSSTFFPYPLYIESPNIGLNNLVYYVHDHLGNTRVTYHPALSCTNNGGTLTLDPPAIGVDHVVDYYPYGKVLRQFVSSGVDRYLTTHHERDKATEHDYRGARYYDADLGRFLSLDPAAKEYPRHSAYSYVAGNPVTFIDPTGRNVDGYKNDIGEYVWVHDKKSKAFRDADGRLYKKVSDDYFEFSDLAWKDAAPIYYKGTLDVGAAEYDDIIAAIHSIKQEMIMQRGDIQFGKVAGLFDFSNVNAENGWDTHAGQAFGGKSAAKLFDTPFGGQSEVHFGMDYPDQTLLTGVAQPYSPTTGKLAERNSNGSHNFPEHPQIQRPFGHVVLGSNTNISFQSGEYNVIILKTDNGSTWQGTQKYFSRTWPAQLYPRY